MKNIRIVNEEVKQIPEFASFGEEYDCLFQVDLKENSFTLSQISETTQQRFGAIFKNRTDYRQMMLSYVLKFVDRTEKERMIQTFLPERLSAILNSEKTLECDYYIDTEGKRILNHLKIVKIGKTDRAFLGIIVGKEKQEDAGRYQIGSRKLLTLFRDTVRLEEISNYLGEEFQIENQPDIEEAKQYISASGDTLTALLIEEGAALEEEAAILKWIRKQERYRFLPVVVCLKEPDETATGICLKNGATDFIVHPFMGEIIKNRMHRFGKERDAMAMLDTVEKDTLTGMYTKEFFYRYAGQEVDTNGAKQFILICTDIENFRMHNEKYGHAVGDLILTHVAGNLQRFLPPGSICGRLSGDVFAALCEKNRAGSFEELVGTFRNHAPVPNLVVKIGMVEVEPETAIPVLCDHAQAAIAKIKQKYGVDIAAYDDDMRLERMKEQNILDSMEIALEQKQFQVYYQPKYDTATGLPAGAEALVRWMHPEYGFMNPGEFIPLFEKIGFIRGLDRYIWAKVCSDIKRWQAMGLPIVPVSINLSRRDFETGDMAEWIIHLADQMGIEHQLIHCEVTESAFTESPQLISECIGKLHREGFVIELDDFGAGYSSLTMLNSMDLDVMKIDKSIVQQDIPGSERNVLEFCTQLAKMMNLQIVAEGVETEAQKERVVQLGCDIIQGYYYRKPMPVGDFELFLRKKGGRK